MRGGTDDGSILRLIRDDCNSANLGRGHHATQQKRPTPRVTERVWLQLGATVRLGTCIRTKNTISRKFVYYCYLGSLI